MKKKITSFLLAVTLMFSGIFIQNVWAGTENQQGKSETQQTRAASNIKETAGTVEIGGETYNNLTLNKVYEVNTLVDQYSSTYRVYVNIPVSGRVKIILDDCYSDRINPFYYSYSNGESIENTWWDKQTESADSGWMTVKKGVYAYSIKCNKTLNKEAKIQIKFESSNAYLGETEDNDTYDTATELPVNTVYEGDYSKVNDVDIYKFQMKSAGLVKISCTNECDLYQEDSDGNLESLNERDSSIRRRLPAGTYYLKVEFYGERDKKEYTIAANVSYEASDAYEQEFNNVKGNANRILANHWYTGSVDDDEDVDCFRIDVAKDSCLSLEFRVPRQTPDDTIRISLRDSGMKTLVSASNTENPYLKTKEIVCPAGTYYVRVNAGYLNDFQDDYKFNVNQRTCVYVSKISLPKTKTIISGEKYTLKPTISPQNAYNKGIKWSSSNTNVATVDENGVVKAINGRIGTAVITARTTDGSGVKASCKIQTGYRLSYDLDKGKLSSSNPNIFTGKKIKLKKPTRKGYNFAGWYDPEYYMYDSWDDIYYYDPENRIDEITSNNIHGNLKLEAIWNKVTVGQPTIRSFVNKSGKKAVVSYKGVSKARGYEIVYSKDKKFKKSYSKIQTTAKSVTLKNLSKKKTYYVKVRAYRVDSTGAYVYGKYSSVKSIKIMK